MPIHWIFAALHLVALGIGLGAIWARASAQGAPHSSGGGAMFSGQSLGEFSGWV